MKRLVIEYWIPLVVWLVVIYCFSTDAFGSAETSRIIIPVLKFFFPWLSPHQLEFWHAVIRKAGHVTEYFILALFTYRSLKREQPNLMQVKIRTMSFVFLAATLDEFHQRLTLFRTASPLDVGYDCFGAVSALWMITLYETWRLRTRSLL